jgi:hypothetical protein
MKLAGKSSKKMAGKFAKKWRENQNLNKFSGLGGTFFLPELVGPAVAAELLLVSTLLNFFSLSPSLTLQENKLECFPLQLSAG